VRRVSRDKVGSALDSSLPSSPCNLSAAAPSAISPQCCGERVGRDERGQQIVGTTIWCAAPSCPCQANSNRAMRADY
jgi:hypothetical protein